MKKHKALFSKSQVLGVAGLACVLTGAVCVVVARLRPEWSLALQISISVLWGLVIIPILLTVFISARVGVSTVLLYVFLGIFKHTKAISRLISHDMTTEQANTLTSLGYVPLATKSISSLAVRGRPDSELHMKASYRAPSHLEQNEVYLYEDFTIIRYIPDIKELPEFVINSLLNNDTAAAIHTGKMRARHLDMGSDFGKYVQLSVADSKEVDILQIVDPVLMLEWLSRGIVFDAAVSQNTIDFVFSYKSAGVSLEELIHASNDLSKRIVRNAAKKHSSSIDRLLKLKNTTAPITTVLDYYALNLVKLAGIVVVIFAVIGFMPKGTPFILTAIVGALFAVILFWVAGMLIVYSYIFVIYAISSMLVFLLVKTRTIRLKKQYGLLAGKYY